MAVYSRADEMASNYETVRVHGMGRGAQRESSEKAFKMRFRTVAACILVPGVLSFAMMILLFLAWQRNRVEPDPGFLAVTTVVTDENFGEVVLASNKPVVVDFYGDYCAVCRQLEPRLLAMANEYSDAAVFVRVNVQDAPVLLQQYEVKRVPTLVLFHKGERLFQGAGLSAIPPIETVLQATAKGRLP